MIIRLPIPSIIAFLASLPLCGWAAPKWSERPIVGRVLDAETARPVGRATVTLDYSNDNSRSPHPTIRREADADGEVTVFAGVAMGKSATPPQWRGEAPGYATHWVDGKPGQPLPPPIPHHLANAA